MSTRVKWAAAVLTAITVLAFKTLSSKSTDYHMREFLYSITSVPRTSSWRDWFSRDYITWTLRGRPTDAQLYDRAGDHERELLRRGAFERKEFVLQFRPPSERNATEIGAFLTTLGSDRKWRARVHRSSPRFTITATPENMRRFETAIRQYDRSSEPGDGFDQLPHPDGAANASQQLTSETNRASPAAGSRR